VVRDDRTRRIALFPQKLAYQPDRSAASRRAALKAMRSMASATPPAEGKAEDQTLSPLLTSYPEMTV
jgi:hypothetical protein